MQSRKAALALLLAHSASASTLKDSPVNKVVTFIKELKSEVEGDKKTEEEAYNKYSAWCKETTDKATADIADNKKVIEEEQAKIEAASGSGASSSTNIEYLKKQIAENEDHTAKTQAIRDKAKLKFIEASDTMKNAIKSMEAMKSELTEGSEGSSFLSVAKKRVKKEDMARLLKISAFTSKLSSDTLGSLENFALGEGQFMQMQGQLEPESALGGVVNVIQETLEQYNRDLKAATDEEEEQVTSFEKLMKSLSEELTSLKETLAEKKTKQGDSARSLADAKALREETQAELKANQKLLTETSDQCKEKADQFATRTKLRDEELSGINKALEILDSESAKTTFANSAKISLAQISSSSHSNQIVGKAFNVLKTVSSKFFSAHYTSFAQEVQAGGHFDKVINTIEKQIKDLRAQEIEDVEHRDRCEKQLSKSAALISELSNTVKKADTALKRLSSKNDELQKDYDAYVASIAETKKEIADRTNVRNQEHEEFKVALQHDKDGLKLVKEATKEISAFYKNNPALMQQKPDAGFDNANYKGKTGSANSVITLLKMVADDIQGEISGAQADDDKDQDQYASDYKALENKLRTQEAAQITTEKALADVGEKISAKEGYKAGQDSDKAEEEANKKTLDENCAWVTEKFESRRANRKAEIDGLVEAKGLLENA
eukprot:TRINITY_DN731_c0_g2_i3.p1 TRINITY_DN731_c0_g2~~TRINITY_DN731_c0_g2_i3.p1  ORF type:complete len:665 (+),score=231.59 TRINITY_DN731_c0_g2_i3:99-2093(+)